MESRFILSLVSLLLITNCAKGAQQKVKLSDSYLPVTMQLIAHFTDQMDHLKPASSSAATTKKPTTKPAASSGSLYTWTESPNVLYEESTQQHRPGVFAPLPPQHYHRTQDKDNPGFMLLPVHNQHKEYEVIQADLSQDEQLLAPESGQIQPLTVEPPASVLLPPSNHEIIGPEQLQFANPRSSEAYSLDLTEEELSENSLQFLSSDVRDILKLAHDKYDDRAFVNSLEDRQSIGLPGKAQPPKMSQSNLRLTLLYDLLSRDAKKQNLAQYGGFSDAVLHELIEAGKSGPRDQLKFALKKMVDRKDCKDTYANNRAKDMVKELGTEGSSLSREIKDLEVLTFVLL